MYASQKITSVAATVAAVMGIDAPEKSAPANKIVVDKAMAALADGEVFDRALIYNPDAIAFWLYPRYTDLFAPMMMRTSLQLPLESVMPSVTPVCFSSIYTGTEPSVHGIRKYEKPVVKTDSLFDAAIRAGKKCAIVSYGDSSMSKIFLEREMDYFIMNTVAEVTEKACELIREDKYDLIAVYHGNYDSAMHKNGPESEVALTELKRNSNDFATLIDLAKSEWKSHNTFYGYCPDHGCHLIDEGSGSHGLDMDEDMLVLHAYGWQAKR